MTEITVPCAICSGTGWATHEDRHTETRQDQCRTCGGTGQVPARPGVSRATSWPDAVPGAEAGALTLDEPAAAVLRDIVLIRLEDGGTLDRILSSGDIALLAIRAANAALLSRLSTPPDLIQAAREAGEGQGWRDRGLTNAERLIVFASYHAEKLGPALAGELEELAVEWMEEVDALRALQSSTPSREGASGRRPDGHGLSSSGPGPTVPAPAGASIPGAGDLAAQVADQCKVVAHLARALARVHDDYTTLATERVFTSIMHDVGQRSAELMEMLGEALNNMDATSTEDEWTDPIFEAAQIAFPIRARDQRAEREDGASRLKPEAASPVRAAEAPSSIAQDPASPRPSSQEVGDA